MQRQIRGANGMPIGHIVEDSSTKQFRAYKRNGTFMGWYDSISGITYRANGQVFARSNMVSALLFED